MMCAHFSIASIWNRTCFLPILLIMGKPLFSFCNCSNNNFITPTHKALWILEFTVLMLSSSLFLSCRTHLSILIFGVLWKCYHFEIQFFYRDDLDIVLSIIYRTGHCNVIKWWRALNWEVTTMYFFLVCIRKNMLEKIWWNLL